jgi:hypothetical protein
MGRRGRRGRNHQTEKPYHERIYYENDRDEKRTGRDPTSNHCIGSYNVTRHHEFEPGQCQKSHEPFEISNSDHQRHEPRQEQGYQPPRADHDTASFNPILLPIDHVAFLARSKRFKNHLLAILKAGIRQIEQWYPDEDEESSTDGMDWQPECEVVIPVPSETHYVWDPTPAKDGEIVWGRGTLKMGLPSVMPAGLKRKIREGHFGRGD